MNDLLKELQNLQLEVNVFVEDMENLQSKFASRTASLEDYYDKERVIEKARSILSKYESLKAELEAELDGETDTFLASQLVGLISNIDTMKAEVSSLSKTLREIAKGLIPKTLEQYARKVRKQVQTYFNKPMLSHSKKNNQIRSDLNGAKGKKFFQTTLNIKGSEFGIVVVEPLDGDYTQKMPNSGNVFWKGKDISTIESWVKNRFKGKGVLSEVLDPFVNVGKGAELELKTEIKGYGQIIGGMGSDIDKVYHFKPGTVLQYTSMRSRGDFFLRVIKLNAGRDNQYSVGETINQGKYFGDRERINGEVKSAICEHWGKMYVMRKHINVLNMGKGSGGNFDPGL